MTLNFRSIFRGDPHLWGIFLALLIISTLQVFTASSTLIRESHSTLSPISAHLGFVLLSIVTAWVVSRCPARLFHLGVLLYVIGILFQLVAIFNGKQINDATRWVTLAGFSFQPSEMIKPGMVFLGCAIYTSKSKSWGSPQKRFWWYIGLMALPTLIVGRDNLSTGLILVVFILLFAWLCDAPKKEMFKTVSICSILGLFGFLLLITLPAETLEKIRPRSSTWQARIVGRKDTLSDTKQTSLMLAPKNDSLSQGNGVKSRNYKGTKFEMNDETAQANNAKIAIARSKGVGVGPGRSKQRDLLPQAFSDYIYAITIEEYGILGMLALPLLFLLFYLRIAVIASRSQDLYSRYLLLGFGLIYTIQAMINMGVSAGILPVTGQTLPLVSRGGSSLLFTSISFGVIFALSNSLKPKSEIKSGGDTPSSDTDPAGSSQQERRDDGEI